MTILRYLKPNSLIFDVGGHMGDKSDYFESSGHMVVCYEPQKKCYNHLKSRFKNRRVSVRNLVLGSEWGKELPFYICNSTTLSTLSDKWRTEGRFSQKYIWDKIQKVDMSTLDYEMELFGVPEYIKIDVEGYEREVINGLSRQVPFISFEYTKEFWQDAVYCCRKLKELGFRKFNFTVGEFNTFIFPLWKNMEVLISFVEGLNDPLLFGDIYARV